MGANNLSFTIGARNAATSALNSLQNQVNSLKNGIKNIGNNANAANNYLNSLNRGASNTSRAFGTLGSTITKTIGIFGGFKIVNSIFNSITSSIGRAIERLDTMDLFTQKMTLITGSADLASQALEHMQKTTKGTPYALDIAARSVQNFTLRGMQIQDAAKSVDIWMDAVSTYGKGTNEQFESVTDAISKMRTKGTVEMRYLNRLFAAGINPVQMYATATGQSAQDVQTALSNKDISASEFLDTVETAMREGTNGVLKIEGNAKKFATTWAATMANMTIAIARGVAQVAKGLDTFFTLFNENGLKGILKGYGEGIENFLTPIGETLGKAGITVKTALNNMKKEQLTFFAFTDSYTAKNAEKIAAHYNSAGQHFKDGFFGSFAPYLEQAVIKFEDLRRKWSDVSETFSAGVAKISEPLGRLIGTYLGETVTGIEDIGIAFGNWLNLKLPPFFDKLERTLNWFIDHKDGVINSAKLIIKALLGFSVLNTIQNVLIGFNDKLKAINNTLAFFTLGKVQLPTMESIYTKGYEKKNQKAIAMAEKQNELTQKRNSLEAIYNRDSSKVQAQSAKDVANLEKNQIRDEIKVAAAHRKANDKLLSDKTKAEDKLNLDKGNKLSKLDATFLSGSQKADTVYSAEIAKINKTKQQDTQRILKAQQTSLAKTTKNGAASNALLKQFGLTSADYSASKIMSQAELEKNSKMFDQIYKEMQTKGIDPKSSPILNDIYNSRNNAELAKKQALATRDATKTSLLNNKRSGVDALELATANKLNKINSDYSKKVDALNKSTVDQMGTVRGSYNAKKRSTSASSKSKLADIQSAYDLGIAALDSEPTKKGNKFTDWIKNSFKKTGAGVKNSAKYVKDSAVATGRGTKEVAAITGQALLGGAKNIKSGAGKVVNDVVKGFEKFGNVKVGDIADDFKALGQATKGTTKNTGKGIGSFFKTMFSGFGGLKKQDTLPKTDLSGAKNFAGGVGNFFGTMFSGFKGLGNGQSAKVALSGTEEVAEKSGLLTTIVTKLGTAFQAVTGWITSFVSTIGGAVVGIGLAAAAIGALTAGLGLLNPGNKVSDGINSFFQSFSEWCMTIADNAPILIQNFVNGLINNLPTLVSQGVNLLLALVNGILTGLPRLLAAGASILLSLIGGIAQVLPELVYQGFNALGQFIAGIIQNLPNIISAAWDLIKTLAVGILQNAPVIIASAIKLIGSFIMGIGSMVGQVFEAVKNLIVDSWNYLTSHPEEVWNAITGFCGTLWDALLSGLYKAADMFNAGWLLDALGAVRPEAAQGGAETAQATVDEANSRFSQATLDLQSMWANANTEDAKAQAQQIGTDVAGGFTDTIDAEMAQEAIDASAAGTDTATNYTSGLTSGLAAGNESVNQSLSSVGTEGLANLQVNFSPEQLGQVGLDFMTALNNALVGNAPIVYQSIAVFTNNCLTQLEAGLNNPERAIPQTIADSLVSLLAGITQTVIDYCTNINNKLTETYNTLLTTIGNSLGDFAAKHTNVLIAIFPTFENTIQEHLDGAVQKYTNFYDTITKKLNDLNTFHYDIGVAMMESLARGINDTMPQVTTTAGALVQKLKETFENGLGIHSPSDYMIWVGQMMLAGLLQGMDKDQISAFVASVINDMRNSFKNGKFNADELVDYLGSDSTLNVIKYLELIGDQTVSEMFGDGGTPAIVTEALKYVGYAPGGGNSMFGLHYGNPGAWCASFVRYCAEKVGVEFPPTNYVPAVLDWSIATGRYTQTPQPGYAAIFGGGSHIELVAGVNGGTVDMVGGNTGRGEVKHRPRSDATSYVALDGGHSTLTLKDTIQQAWNKKFNPLNLGGYNPSGGAAQWAPLVLQALKMLGQPASLLNGVLWAIQNESGGNPNAINLWDSNAAAGHPSQGLLQTIPSTFAAYALPGYNTNILDPLSNILAGLRYMIGRYGSIANVINPRMPKWYGYAVGTRKVPQDMPAIIHKDEAIIPASQNPYSNSGGNYLADLFQNVIGRTGINDLNFDMEALSGGSGNSTSVNNNLNNVFNIHNSSDVDADRNVGNIEKTLHKILQDGLRAGGSR